MEDSAKARKARRKPGFKHAHEETSFTPEQVRELQRCSADPVYFAKKYVKIQHPKRGAIPFELFDYQEDMMRAFQHNRFNIILSARQTGKQLPLDTKLPTPTGWTTMGEIQVGDYVFGADGKPTQVTWISEITVPQVAYKLYFDTGETQIACSDHEWEVEEKYKKDPVVLTTQQMVDKGVTLDKNESRFKIKTTTPIDLPEKKLPIDPYILGVWLGDGVSRTSEISTHKNDLELFEYFSGWKLYQRSEGLNNIRTTVYGLRTLLREANLIQNKHIPLEYLRSSYEQRLSLLQGLMDTDGYVDSLGRGQCEITLANETLAKDVFHLVCSLGLKAAFKERTVNDFVRYEIKFSAYSNEIKIFRLKRKLKNMKKSPETQRRNSTKKRSIQRIERVDSEPMKCIGVDNEDKLYLFGDACIPTHNSITSAVYLLWFAMFHFDKKILIASNKNKGAMEMIRRIRYAYLNLPMWLKPGIVEDGWNMHTIAFDNESRIDSTATSEDSGRGESISILYLDEFAFVKRNIQEEFWASILPTLSTGGNCIMSSTPNGDSDLFATLWRSANVNKPYDSEELEMDPVDGEDAIAFVPLFIAWDRPPGRDEKFKQTQIALIGDLKWKQEYECQFLSSDALLFNTILLANMTPAIEKIQPEYEIEKIKFYAPIKEKTTYLVGVDPSTGSGNDFSVIEVFEFPSLEQVAEFRSNTMSSPFLYNMLKNIILFLEKKHNNIYFSVENNGVGEGVIALYEVDENPPATAEFLSETGKNRLGMTTTKPKKVKACLTFKELFEKNNIVIKSRILLNEMKTYVRKAGAYMAQRGSTDDCIAAVLIVMRIIEEMSMYEEEAYAKLYTHSGGNNWWEKIDGTTGAAIVPDIQNDEDDSNNEDDGPLPFITT